MNLYDKVSFSTSRLVTQSYSTSFSLATRLFDKETRESVYSIYGFVRIADEIVDSFHDYDKESLLDKFENDCFDAIKSGISTNPVLNSFQFTVNKYHIPNELVSAFLKSMRLDLYKKEYTGQADINEYIFGSAEVVGLMCLYVFCKGNDEVYNRLHEPAMKLGSAFQKVNFLRDLNFDYNALGRTYFNVIYSGTLDEKHKNEIVKSIKDEFAEALGGIKLLPGRSKLAVYLAYNYYYVLLNKIGKTPAHQLINKRIRVSDYIKIFLLLKSIVVYKLKFI